MMSMKKTVGILLAASLGFAGTASAQNLDLDEVGALLSLPVITGNNSSGVFIIDDRVDSQQPTIAVSISGLTITEGHATSGTSSITRLDPI